MPDIDPDDLGLVVWAALGYGRRLPDNLVPPSVWAALSAQWQGRIMDRKNSRLDDLGAELQKG